MGGGGCRNSPGFNLGPVELGGTFFTCPPTSHFAHVENESEIDTPPPTDYQALRRPCSYFSAFTIIPDRPVSNNNLEFEELTKKQAAAGWPDLVKWDSILLCFQNQFDTVPSLFPKRFFLFNMIFFSKPMQAISNQEECKKK